MFNVRLHRPVILPHSFLLIRYYKHKKQIFDINSISKPIKISIVYGKVI